MDARMSAEDMDSAKQKRIDTLRRCIYAHVWVFPQVPDGHTVDEMKEMTRKFSAVLQRNSDRVAIDVDFEGHFYLDNFAEVNTEAFIQRVSSYFTLAKNRQLCRVNGQIEPKELVPENLFDDQPKTELEAMTMEEYVEDEQETEVLDELIAEDFSYEELGYESFDTVTLSASEEVRATEPVEVREMSCCGSRADSEAYDRLTKHCCQTDLLGLSSKVQVNTCEQ